MRLDREHDVALGSRRPGADRPGIARDLSVVEGCELVAVGSRSLARAEAFAAEHAASGPPGGVRAHGSYRELVADPEVDVVYIATPHRQHAAIARAALAAGKAVLVEKAFTCTVAGAQGVADVAGKHGVFAMEAMWTRFIPLVARMRELIAEGAIGEVRAVHADLGVVKAVTRRTGCGTRRRAAARCSTSACTRCHGRRWCSGRRTRCRCAGWSGPPGWSRTRRCCSGTTTGAGPHSTARCGCRWRVRRP